MLNVRKSEDRGGFDHGWLKTYHTFSFAEYYDPEFMGFGSLRVINEDFVAPSSGFPMHGHQNMEIVTYIIDGALEHRDSLGNGSIIRRGDVQRMSAGPGITHSEFNPSKEEPVHLLQIWLLPKARGLPSGYEEKRFDGDSMRGKLKLLVSPDGAGESISIQTDALVFASILEGGDSAEHSFAEGRVGWIQVAAGSVRVNDVTLTQGDGVSIDGEPLVSISSPARGEFLLFDMPWR
ncbi:MAG: pirin family protein [Planctomycetes bacterium]|nr:pirin family protein [Planctomycetota bacterium]